MSIDPTDPEIRAFIAASSAGTYSDLAAAIRAKFGEGRAWPVELIAAIRLELRPPRRFPPSRFDTDEQVAGFIADRADLLSLDRLLAAGAATFGKARFPSRSQLYRFVRRLRERRSLLRTGAAV